MKKKWIAGNEIPSQDLMCEGGIIIKTQPGITCGRCKKTYVVFIGIGETKKCIRLSDNFEINNYFYSKSIVPFFCPWCGEKVVF